MPKRDFPTLLTAFLAAAATGAAIGGAKEAKAQDHLFRGIVVCDEDGFCEFGETLPFNEGPFDESFFQVVEPLPPLVLPPSLRPFPFP